MHLLINKADTAVKLELLNYIQDFADEILVFLHVDFQLCVYPLLTFVFG